MKCTLLRFARTNGELTVTLRPSGQSCQSLDRLVSLKLFQEIRSTKLEAGFSKNTHCDSHNIKALGKARQPDR